MSSATAEACANFALVKYWGKRDLRLNLPAQGSLSLAVDALKTETRLRFSSEFEEDRLYVDGQLRTGAALIRAQRVLDRVRAQAGISQHAWIDSENSFPYGAGLASSASGMAALALAASRAAGLTLSQEALSALARRGSGSAARSIHGGFVEWRPGEASDGEDSYGVQLYPPKHWDLRVLVLLVEAGPKMISSTEGMLKTAAESPYHAAWLSCVEPHLKIAREAIRRRDLPALGAVAEASCLAMHADMLSAGLIYWRGSTLELIHKVRALRPHLPIYFTIDAGPHLKLLCEPEHLEAAHAALKGLPEIQRIISCRLAGPARLIEP